MIEKLKQYPLVGLTLAIASGYVLAHMANKLVDDFWFDDLENFLLRDGWSAFWLAIAAALVLLAVWHRTRIASWVRKHKAGVTFTAFGAVLAVAKGGHTYTVLSAAGYSDDVARLSANRVAAVWAVAYAALVLLYFFVAKLIHKRRTVV
jgi:hypothetical protein